MSYESGWYVGAARLWAEAIQADSKLVEDRESSIRYDAACSVALAGCGRGKDEPKPEKAMMDALRARSLGWLRDEREMWAVLLKADPNEHRLDIFETLAHWKADSDLAGVRDEAELAKLPEAERAGWKALWASVDDLLKKVKP